MADTLTVLIGGEVAGMITRTTNNLLRFDYDAEYRRQPQATPLSLSMPLSGSTFADTPANRAVTGFLAGLLPDDDETLKRWASYYGVRAGSPFSILGTPVGRDCAGGVSFCLRDELAGFLARGGRVEWMTDTQVAETLRDLRRDPTLVLGRSFSGQFSLAGAQSKTALRQGPNGQWGRPSGTEPTTHILKPSSAAWRDQAINEHLCLAAASIAGLTVVRSEVMRFGDQEAVVVARYDRVVDRSTGHVTRVHQEDLCQALGVGPEKKYESDGGPTPRDIASLLRRVMPSRDADAAVRAFADALIWNWIIVGTDAHAKNYSLLLRGGAVRFAPLYDITSVLPYLGTRSSVSQEILHVRTLTFAMRLGNSRDVYPLRNPWPQVADDLGLTRDYLVGRGLTLASATPSAFAQAAGEPAIAALRSGLATRLVDLVAKRAADCVSVLS